MMLTKKFFIYTLVISLIFSIIPCHLTALTGEEEYYQADVFYKKFLEYPEKLKYRENWLECIEKFKTAYTKDPSGNLASASLYMCGKLFQELYYRSYKGSDKESSIEYFERVIKSFPTSYYNRLAEEGLDAFQKRKTEQSGNSETPSPTNSYVIEKKERNKICKTSKAEYKASAAQSLSNDAVLYQSHSNPPTSSENPLSVSSVPKRLVTITGLRVWSNPNYTRIVVDADNETAYNHSLLEKDASAKKPQRLYIDFEKSKLGKNIERIIPINDNLLTSARAGQYQPDAVRVVVDIKSFKSYKIFSLRNPFRIVIDVWGRDAGNGYVAKQLYRQTPATIAEKKDYKSPTIAEKKDYKSSTITERKETQSWQREYPKKEPIIRKEPINQQDLNITTRGLAKQFALGVRRIVIDPGHGGCDAGAVGYYKYVLEKDIVLSLAKRLARKIQQQIGCEVILTRSTDRFLSLEERTAIANTKNADLFISLHTNAHKDRRAYGIETYFLNLATDEDAIQVAARENATSRKNISDLQKILNDLMHNAKINESSRLAAYIQKTLCKRMRRHYSRINNKGVKQAPFYVLLGAHMPSVLVEVSFISNKRECERLNNADYQEHLCEAIVDGVREYIMETNPTALLRLRSNTGG